MLRKFNNANLFIFIFFIFCFSLSHSQTSNRNSNQFNCIFGNITTNGNKITEYDEETINDLINLNFDKLLSNSILMLFEEKYQLYLFRMSNCTEIFLYNDELKKYAFNNSLHLFSIEGKIETNSNIIKLVIQTKKEFQIFYYNNRIRINTNPEKEIFYNIKTNIFPNFRNKFIFDEEYDFIKNQNINIFNDDEKIFNDICFKYKTFNITKSPVLRKSLYYYKNDISTYPLLDSNNNCFITNNYISYENESFILEYQCIRNFNISSKSIDLNRISLVTKEEIETYEGPNSLKDQQKILKCHKDSFKPKNIGNNIGFYISLVLILIVVICIIFLFIQKNEIKYDQELYLEAPPKKKTLKEAIKEKKDKKNVNFATVEIIAENNKEKKKKKRKKKKQMIESDNDNDNEEDQENNNDLNWYSNSIELNEEKEKNDSLNEEKDYYKTDKPKSKKKKGKKKKGKKSKKNRNQNNEDININNSYDDKNEQDSDFNMKNNEFDFKNKTMIKFPSAYKKFQINYVNKLKEKLNLRRLVIITNLGNNLNKNDIIGDNDNFDSLKNQPKKLNENEYGNYNNVNNSYNNIKNSVNNLISSGKDTVEKGEEENRKEKIANIIGLEDNTFMSNIMRDYLNYEDVVIFDKRDNCQIFCHFMKLKNDLINIFCCNYSFVPYTARLIKFSFFFHFLFYLETLCIGQKYYFNKYYSDEIQDFLIENHFYDKNYILNSLSNNNITNINYTDINNNTFPKNAFNVEAEEIDKIHYLYTFKYAFPRVLIPAALSLVSYFFTALLTPRRKIMKLILNTSYKSKDKLNKVEKIMKDYKIIYLISGIVALLLMVFFFYSTINYFYVFEEAKYDIPQSFILSGLLRFIFDIILWAFITELRVCGIQIHNESFYNLINKIYEIN